MLELIIGATVALVVGQIATVTANSTYDVGKAGIDVIRRKRNEKKQIQEEGDKNEQE